MGEFLFFPTLFSSGILNLNPVLAFRILNAKILELESISLYLASILILMPNRP